MMDTLEVASNTIQIMGVTTSNITLQPFDWHYFIILFIGTTDVTFAVCMALFGLIGNIVSIVLHFLMKGQSNPATPEKFSIKFSIKNNFLRYVISFILTLIVMRIMQEVVGKEVTTSIAIGLGLVSDKWIEVVSKVMNGYSWSDAFKSIIKKAE